MSDLPTDKVSVLPPQFSLRTLLYVVALVSVILACIFTVPTPFASPLTVAVWIAVIIVMIVRLLCAPGQYQRAFCFGALFPVLGTFCYSWYYCCNIPWRESSDLYTGWLILIHAFSTRDSAFGALLAAFPAGLLAVGIRWWMVRSGLLAVGIRRWMVRFSDRARKQDQQQREQQVVGSLPDNLGPLEEESHVVSAVVWRCSDCGELQEPHCDACWNCGAERPKTPLQPAAAWRCDDCDELQEPQADTCSNCGAERPEAKPQPIPEDSPNAVEAKSVKPFFRRTSRGRQFVQLFFLGSPFLVIILGIFYFLFTCYLPQRQLVESLVRDGASVRYGSEGWIGVSFARSDTGAASIPITHERPSDSNRGPLFLWQHGK